MHVHWKESGIRVEEEEYGIGLEESGIGECN